MKEKFSPRKLMEQAVDVMRQSIGEPRSDGKASPLVGAFYINRMALSRRQVGVSYVTETMLNIHYLRERTEIADSITRSFSLPSNPAHRVHGDTLNSVALRGSYWRG